MENNNKRLVANILMIGGALTVPLGLMADSGFAFMGVVAVIAGLGVRYNSKPAALEKPKFILDEKAIMRLATRLGGKLTAVELSMHTKLSLEEAEKKLDALYAQGIADLQVNEEGNMEYHFRQLSSSRKNSGNDQQLL